MRRVNIDAQLLRSFVAVVETGGFARAADTLAITQPAMSQQMKRLEEMLGRPLFRREGRSLVLTAPGELLLGYARRMLELNDDLYRRFAEDEPREIVNLGMPEHFSEALLPLVIAAVHERYPNVQLVVKVGRSQALAEQVEDGRLHLALLVGEPLEGPGTTRLHVAPLAWFGAEAGGTAGGAVERDLRLVLFRAPCGIRQLAVAALEREAVPWRCVHESEDLSALRAAVRVDLGLTVLPNFQAYAGIRPLGDVVGLPALPGIAVSLRRRPSWRPRSAQGLDALVVELWEAFRSGPTLPQPAPPEIAAQALLAH
ncbi:LysR family transcriptional regulator [Salinarimonas chemoclinalis]|uniref:LysR family transcriptional regulator n=1 Tax=Salinarimonas chemoclinalis TaxID=3241599 RepID=UPI003558C27D